MITLAQPADPFTATTLLWPWLQVWYDDPSSLALKYHIAAEHGLMGIGFWNLDCLDYDSKDSLVQHQTAEMWQAVKTAVAAFSNQAEGVESATQAVKAQARRALLLESG